MNQQDNLPDPSTPIDSKAQPPVAESKPKRKRRGRWIWYGLLSLFLLLLVAIGLAPTLASTRWAQGRVVGMVNDRMNGKLAVDTISLSWFDECRLTGVKIDDLQNREVLAVRSARIPKGVWQMIRAGMNVGKIEIDGASVNAFVDDEYNVSITDAIGFGGESEPEPELEPTGDSPVATLVLSDARINLIRPDGRKVELTDINITASSDRDGNVDADISAKMPNDSVIKSQLQAAKILSARTFDLGKLTASAKVTSTGDIDLSQVADVLLEPGQVSGLVNMDIDAKLTDGVAAANVKSSATGLQWARSGGESVQPIDVQLTGAAQSDGDETVADLTLASSAGELNAKLTGSMQAMTIDVGALVEALIAGTSIALPEMTADVTGKLDLERLAQSVPGLLQLRDDAAITSGSVAVEALSVRGGDMPSVRVAMTATGVTARSGGQTVQWQPIEVSADIAADENRRLRLNFAKVAADFVTLTASGSPEKLNLVVDGDFARFQQQVGQIFDVGVDRIAGQLKANVDVLREGDDRVDLNLDASITGLEVIQADNTVRVADARIVHQSKVAIVDGHLGRIESQQSNVTLDQSVAASASGWYDPRDNTYDATVEMTRGDLDYLNRVLRGLGVDALDGFAGTLAAKADVKGQATLFQSSGSATGGGLTVDGQSISNALNLGWTKLSFDSDKGVAALDELRLESDFGQVTATGVAINTGSDFSASGDVAAKADLARAAVLIASFGDGPPIAMQGALTLNAKGRTSGKSVTLTGDGKVENLRMGELPPEDEPLTFAFDMSIDNQAKQIDVKQVQLAAAPISLDIVGSVADYDGEARLDLRGKHTMKLKRITDWVHEVAPSTRDLFTVVGAQSGVIAASGPVNRPGVSPAYRELTGMMETGFRTATIYGVQLGAATLEPRLERGVIKLPATSIATEDGTVNIGGELDLTGEMTARIPGELALLEKVQVTPELAAHVLTRFNPIFGQATAVQGRVNLKTRDIVMPLGDSMTTGGSGTGRLDLRGFRIKPAGVLAELMQLGGATQDEMYTVKVSGADFEIKKGRLHYKDFSMDFADGLFDLMFYGSVGFDDTLDLVVSIPVRENLLRKLNVTGPVVEYAALLNNARIDIPMVGTRENPKLDMAHVDVSGLLEGALLKKGEDITTGKGLEDILKVIPGLEKKDEGNDQKGKKKGGRKRKNNG